MCQAERRVHLNDTRTLMALAAFISAELSFTPTSAQTTAVRGIVTDQTTGAFLPLVNVIVRDSPFGAATDSTGRFEISGIPPDLYVIEFRHVAYKTQVRPLRIVSRDITLAIALQQEPIEFPGMTVTSPVPESIKIMRTYSSTIVTAVQMERIGARRLSDVLRAFEPGASPGYTGRGGRQLTGRVPFLIYLDGAYVQYFPGTLDNIIDVSQIDRIEISRWVGASPNFGPGTSDRVLQIFTKKPQK